MEVLLLLLFLFFIIFVASCVFSSFFAGYQTRRYAKLYYSGNSVSVPLFHFFKLRNITKWDLVTSNYSYETFNVISCEVRGQSYILRNNILSQSIIYEYLSIKKWIKEKREDRDIKNKCTMKFLGNVQKEIDVIAKEARENIRKSQEILEQTKIAKPTSKIIEEKLQKTIDKDKETWYNCSEVNWVN